MSAFIYKIPLLPYFRATVDFGYFFCIKSDRALRLFRHYFVSIVGPSNYFFFCDGTEALLGGMDFGSCLITGLVFVGSEDELTTFTCGKGGGGGGSIG